MTNAPELPEQIWAWPFAPNDTPPQDDLYHARARPELADLAADLTSYTRTVLYDAAIAERDALAEALQGAILPKDFADIVAERDALRAALESIAANTCCDRCQEAALVASQALKGTPNADR